MRFTQSATRRILEAYEEEKARFDGYKGPLFEAVKSAIDEDKTTDSIPEVSPELVDLSPTEEPKH